MLWSEVYYPAGAYPQSKSAGQLAVAESQGSAQLPPISSSASVSNLALAAPPSSSKWNPRTLWRASSKQLPRAGSGSVTTSPPATPVTEMTHRMPFVLRQVSSTLSSACLLCPQLGIINLEERLNLSLPMQCSMQRKQILSSDDS